MELPVAVCIEDRAQLDRIFQYLKDEGFKDTEHKDLKGNYEAILDIANPFPYYIRVDVNKEWGRNPTRDYYDNVQMISVVSFAEFFGEQSHSPPKECSCEIVALLRYGCKCGAITPYGGIT